MPLVNPYCTTAQVAAYIRNNDPAIVPQIEDAINAASRFIDSAKGRDYFEHDHSAQPLVIDKISESIFGNVLYLGLSPIIELIEVSMAGEILQLGVDLRAMTATGKLILLRGSWVEGIAEEDSVQVTGRFGYEQRDDSPDRLIAPSQVPDGIPANINQAAVMIAAAISRRNTLDVVGLDGQRTAITETDVPKAAMTLLGGRSKVMI